MKTLASKPRHQDQSTAVDVEQMHRISPGTVNEHPPYRTTGRLSLAPSEGLLLSVFPTPKRRTCSAGVRLPPDWPRLDITKSL